MSNDKSLIRKNIEDMLSDETFFSVFKLSLKKICPSKKRFLFLFVFLFATFSLLHLSDSIQASIVKELYGINKEFSGPLFSVFAVVLTGYAIFQALANGSTLLHLISISEEDKSKFKHYNLSFFGTTILYLFLIILHFNFSIVLKLIDPNWSFFLFDAQTNTIITLSCFAIYITLILHALIEIKSFVYNLYQCFTMNAVSKGIEYLSEDKDR